MPTIEISDPNGHEIKIDDPDTQLPDLISQSLKLFRATRPRVKKQGPGYGFTGERTNGRRRGDYSDFHSGEALDVRAQKQDALRPSALAPSVLTQLNSYHNRTGAGRV